MAQSASFVDAMKDSAAAVPVAPQGPGPETPATSGQVEAPETGYIGFTPQPEHPEGGNQLTQQQEAALRLAEDLSPDTVVMYDGEKPVTLAEALKGQLRQSDYSKKTEALAREREAHQEQISFIKQNERYINAITSGQPEQVAGALLEIGRLYGVDLSKGGSERTRDPQGRFTSQAIGAEQEVELLDPNDYDADSLPLVNTANAALQQNAALAQRLAKLEQGLGQFSQVAQQQQIYGQMNAVAEEWKGKGFKDVDVQGAASLIGQPINPEQAMFLAHMERLFAHTYNLAKQKQGQPKPQEPGGVMPHGNGAGPQALNDALRQASANVR